MSPVTGNKLKVESFFLRRFRHGFRFPIIENRVPRIRENYHRVPKIREYRVPRITEIRSLPIHTVYQTFSLKKNRGRAIVTNRGLHMDMETAGDRQQCGRAAKSLLDCKQSSSTHYIERLCQVN